MKRSVKVLMSVGLFALAGCAGAGAAEVEPPPVSVGNVEPTFNYDIQPIFLQVCGGCHGPMQTAGLNLTTYEGAMLGGYNGPVIVASSPDDSEVVRRQREGHYGQMSEEELELVTDWISNGALE